MLTDNQVNEIKEHLAKAQNPVFYYDNDADGLCSFLILRRFMGRGKGVAARSYPDLNRQYAKKAEELKADYVFVLDKPVVSREFVEEIASTGVPLVLIDHHDIRLEINVNDFPNLFIYNWAKNKEEERSEEPVSYWIYKITNRKEELWLAVIGCVADHFMPDFVDEFVERYGELWAKDVKKPFDVLYKTEIGRIAQAFNFGLKDSTSHIVQLQNFLILCKGPGEVFLEDKSNSAFRIRYKEIKKKYDILVNEAKKIASEELLFFVYAGDLSISADIANELSFFYSEKYIVVAYKKGAVCNISLRGKNIKGILEKILKNFENATGGGHEDAVGARIKTEDLLKFKEGLAKEINAK